MQQPKIEREGMSAFRMRCISFVVAAIAAVSLLEIVTGREHWPFCAYEMYSHIREEKSVTRLRLFGIPAGNSGAEFPIYHFQYIQPFDSSRLAKAFSKIQERPDHDRLFQKALGNIFERYEKLRQKKRHNGPELRALRLYELHWEIRPGKENSESPSKKTLVAEYAP